MSDLLPDYECPDIEFKFMFDISFHFAYTQEVKKAYPFFSIKWIIENAAPAAVAKEGQRKAYRPARIRSLPAKKYGGAEREVWWGTFPAR